MALLGFFPPPYAAAVNGSHVHYVRQLVALFNKIKEKEGNNGRRVPVGLLRKKAWK